MPGKAEPTKSDKKAKKLKLPAALLDKRYRKESKRLFVKQLACFLTQDQAKMSLKMAMEEYQACEWGKLRRCTPLFGYPTQKEAERVLMEFLS